MPELAEVEYYRSCWDAGLGDRVLVVRLHARKRIFCGTDTRSLSETLTGSRFIASEARGKQMLFRFHPAGWLGIHLGMTGRLRADSDGASEAMAASQKVTRHTPARHPRHDHLVLHQPGRRLVFSDPRLFGRVRFQGGTEPPEWWRNLPPEVLSREFTVARVEEFLARRGRSPIKAVLLMQKRFPGIGNWMADEILWRAGIHPATRAGALAPEQVRHLRREIRSVARTALRSLGANGRDLPRGWLFHERWEAGGVCPRSGAPLVRETIGGRTTCWSPGRQRERGDRAHRKGEA